MFEALLSILEEKAFEHITVKEITVRASVGYATFFRRYPDKEALLHDIAAQEIQNLLNMTLPILDSKDSRASTYALCAYVWDNNAIWKVLLTGGAASVLKEEYLSQALGVAKDRNEPGLWLPEDLAVSFTVTTAIDILAWWLKQTEPFSIEDVAKYMNQLAIEPILSDYKQ